MSHFVYNHTATTDIYTLSLPDALPISVAGRGELEPFRAAIAAGVPLVMTSHALYPDLDPDQIASRSRAIVTDLLRKRRSEEHTSELQSRQYLVCRLLLEKKKLKRWSHM